MSSTFNDDLTNRLRVIERERKAGFLAQDRAAEKTSAAFFDCLMAHYPVPEEPESRKPFRLVRPRRVTHFTHVEDILSPDAFLVRRSGRCSELRLCSVRVPEHGNQADALAAALSQILLFERVTTDYCCRDENGFSRGVIRKLNYDLLCHLR
jgi:hypothetical protein